MSTALAFKPATEASNRPGAFCTRPECFAAALARCANGKAATVYVLPDGSLAIKHDRGNTADRARRKGQLLEIHGHACAYCGEHLTPATTEQDRIIAGCEYRLYNLLPACKACNAGRSNAPFEHVATPRAIAAAEVARSLA